MTEPTRDTKRFASSHGLAAIGRTVALRAVTQQDYSVLYRAEHSLALGSRWRLQGNAISPEDYPKLLWRGVTAQFMVVEAGSDTGIGIVALYNADHADQVAHFAVADLATGGGPTRVAQGAALFLHYAFSTWPFRKLYVEAMEYNLSSYRSMCGRLLEVEGTFREHHYHDGRYWDQVHLAIHRRTWEGWAPRLLAGVLPAATPGDDGAATKVEATV